MRKGEEPGAACERNSDSDRIRTCDLLIRSQLLYPTELRSLDFFKQRDKIMK